MNHLLHRLLETAATTHPHATAVVDGDRSITYWELDAYANQIAHCLARNGIGPGDRVALYLAKSIEAIAGLYGVLKAGAAYVPLETDAPLSRSGRILADCGVHTLVTSDRLSERCCGLLSDGVPVKLLLVLDAERPTGIHGARALGAQAVRGLPDTPPVTTVIGLDLAYILYTSGSTGVPKGVMLSHLNGLSFVHWAASTFALRSDDRLSSLAPLHFDLSIFDIFAAAWAAAAMVLVPRDLPAFPAQLVRFVATSGITVWYSVPAALTMMAARGGLAPGDLPGLRTVLFAGEVFPTKQLRVLMGLLPHARFCNLYGPTETNVCTWYDVKTLPSNDADIPIGTPIDGVELVILTADGRPAGPGEVGELWVRGPTVMQGYWGDPERSATVLRAHPGGAHRPGPVYRTGDLVSQAPDGIYRFHGRGDSQVKVRGYRVELREVERVIDEHPDVQECAVVAIHDGLATNVLKAYVVSKAKVSRQQLVSFCVRRLPRYMIPSLFDLVSRLPRTSTGKVDRRALAGRRGE